METLEKTRVIAPLQKCDRCVAPAWVLAKGLEGELHFCSHHYNKYKTKIDSWAFEVIDEREHM